MATAKLVSNGPKIGAVSTNNSSDEPLLVGGKFEGTVENIIDVGTIIVTVFSDVASATDGLDVKFSSDGVNFDGGDVYTIPAGVQKTFSFQPATLYFKVDYTNGGTIQTVFRLQTQLKKGYVKPSSHRIQDNIISEDDSELVKAVLTAKDDSGVFQNILSTLAGALKVANVAEGLVIAKGDVPGTTFIHKFGKAPDFDTGDGFVTIWDGANDGLTNQMEYIFSETAIIDSISSSINTDTQDIEIQGLDANYDLVVQTITLTGQTRKALDTNLIRVFRLKNVGSVDLAGTVYCYENTTLTVPGVPADTTKIRAIITIGNNQTLMSIYTIPTDKTGYMRDWYAAISSRLAVDSEIKLKARPFGQVFQVKHTSSLHSTGTSAYKHDFVEPEIFVEKTDIIIECDTSQNAVSISAGFDIVLVDNV